MLTEHEVRDKLYENLRIAARAAFELSQGKREKQYLILRRNLKEAEACCRQMAGIREDTRWLPIGMKLAEAQKRCGAWLRAKEPAWRFKGLAEILAAFIANTEKLATKKTGRRGIILPEVQPAPMRTEGRSVAVPEGYKKIAKSGLLLPSTLQSDAKH